MAPFPRVGGSEDWGGGGSKEGGGVGGRVWVALCLGVTLTPGGWRSSTFCSLDSILVLGFEALG